jgi:hypothetical protein
MTDMIDWFRAHDSLMWWLALGSAITFVGTLVLVPILVIRIPADYFLAARRHVSHWRRLHPVPGIALLVFKNACGIIFIIAGIAMLILPGQGFLTILIGVMLVNFPGKYRLERWFIRIRPVARSINWMRSRAGRPPLRMPRRTASG